MVYVILGYSLLKTGTDLHNRSIILDQEYSTKLSNILVHTGFLGLWKKKLGDNTFYKNMELEIMDTSDFDQNKIFVNQNDESYPRMNIPKQVSVS
ncbi:hypothetical protein KJ641_01635, partial [Patescibacteria group bacterium]|nr:hypothetical protein [Patescibacteria group bacterium]